MGRHLKLKLGLTLAVTLTAFSCQKKADEASISESKKYLYYTTGVTNSGIGITSYTAQTSSRKVGKIDLSSRERTTVLDLTEPYQGGTFNIDTGAQSLIDNGSSLLLLTENAVAMSDRKIYSVPKSSPYNTTIYSQDPLALTQTATHITRNMSMDTDGTIIFSKSIGAEKLGTNTLRIPQGANPWINAPGGTCATATTGMNAISIMPPFSPASSGKIIFAHQGNTAVLNRLGIISETGYSVAGNCLIGVQISTTLHTLATNIPTSPAIAFATQGANPTSMVFIPDATGAGGGKLIVAYSAAVATELSNNTNLNYAIVMWTVSETATTANLTAPIVLNRDISVVFGVSAMAYDSTDNSLYVATASQPGVANQTTAGYGYKIEKFTLDLTANTATLVRPNNQPWFIGTSATKGITSLVIGSQ